MKAKTEAAVGIAVAVTVVGMVTVGVVGGITMVLLATAVKAASARHQMTNGKASSDISGG